MLLQDAGVAMRDWSSLYRTPYWGHELGIIDWTGGVMPPTARGCRADCARNCGEGCAEVSSLPLDRVLFVPLQMLYTWRVRTCCGRNWDACRRRAIAANETCVVEDWRREPTDCCNAAQFNRRAGVILQTRRNRFTVKQAAAADVEAAFSRPELLRASASEALITKRWDRKRLIAQLPLHLLAQGVI